jgi:hypothetical protein
MTTPRKGPPLSRAAALDIRFLRRNRVIDPLQDGSIIADWRWLAPAKAKLIWTSSRNELCICWASAELAVSVVNLGGGSQWRPAFLCPLGGGPCSILYFHAGQWGSMRSLGLSYPSRRLTVEDHLDRAAGLRRVKRYTPNDPQLKALEPHPIENHAPVVPFNRLGAEAALASGAGKDLGAFAQDLNLKRANLRVEMNASPRRTMKSAGEQMGIWEDLPVLELEVLTRHGLVKQGELTMVYLYYGALSQGLLDALIFVDILDPSDPHIDIFYLTQGPVKPVRFETVQLTVPTARGRRYLICPFIGRRVGVIGFRKGIWACRDALNVKNASQRSPAFRLRAERRATREQLVQIKAIS